MHVLLRTNSRATAPVTSPTIFIHSPWRGTARDHHLDPSSLQTSSSEARHHSRTTSHQSRPGPPINDPEPDRPGPANPHGTLAASRGTQHQPPICLRVASTVASPASPASSVSTQDHKTPALKTQQSLLLHFKGPATAARIFPLFGIPSILHRPSYLTAAALPYLRPLIPRLIQDPKTGSIFSSSLSAICDRQASHCDSRPTVPSETIRQRRNTPKPAPPKVTPDFVSPLSHTFTNQRTPV